MSVLIRILKWSAIPALLVASLFSGVEARFEPLIDLLICMSAIVLVQRAVWRHQYVSGAGFIAVVVVFSPISLLVKILLLLLLICVTALAALLAAYRMRPVQEVCVTP